MFSSRFGTTFLFTVNVCIYIFRLHYLLCVGMNIRIINNLFQKKSCNFPIVYMYFFKRYQKAFTFFVSGGCMKFPNLIIRIILDLSKYICAWNISFPGKFYLSQATQNFWEYMIHIQTVLFHTCNELFKPIKSWIYPASKRNYLFHSNLWLKT